MLISRRLRVLKIGFLCAIHTACDTGASNGVDYCARVERFDSCLAQAADAGVKDDWADVLRSCDNTALEYARRPSALITPECRTK